MAKVIFLQDLWIEYYGVMQLSAILKRNGHDTEILFDDKENILKKVKKVKPDLIAYSIMSMQWNWTKSISSFLKQNGIQCPQIVGGIHPTMTPDETLEHKDIDMICNGEGDNAILELCDAIDKKKDYSNIQNLWIRKGKNIIKNELRPRLTAEELVALPYPDRDLYTKYDYFKNFPFVTFVASRGCPFKCSFCEVPFVVNLTKGKSTVYQNVDSFIDEIDETKKRSMLKGKLLMFTDSTFNSHKKWFLEFCQKYKERINLPWTCNLRAELVDEEQVKAMKLANIDNVRFGVESGDEEIRKTILNKGRHLTDEKILNCAQLLHKYKIKFVTFNMMAFPTETYEQAWKTIKINQKIKPTVCSMYMLYLYPNLGITNFTLDRGLIDKKDIDMIEKPPYNYHLSLLALHPDRNKDIFKICNLQKFAILVVRWPFLEPLVRKLSELPNNSFFSFIYLVTQAWEWRNWSTRHGFMRLLWDGLLNYHTMFVTKEKDSGIIFKISQLLAKKTRSKVANAYPLQSD